MLTVSNLNLTLPDRNTRVRLLINHCYKSRRRTSYVTSMITKMKGEVNGIYRAGIPVVPTASIQPQGKAVTTWARLKQTTRKQD